MGDSLSTSTSRIKRDLVDNSLRGTKTGTSRLPMIYRCLVEIFFLMPEFRIMYRCFLYMVESFDRDGGVS